MQAPFVEFAEGQIVFSEGDPGRDMYVIESGEVEIARGATVIGVLQNGDLFGEMSLLEDLPRMATARARSKLRALKIEKSNFAHVVARNPEIAVRIMRTLSSRLRAAEARSAAPALPAAESGAASSNEAATTEPTRGLALVHEESGQRFDLPGDKNELLVGRPDPISGITPEINLLGLDPKRTLSRRHARVLRQNGQLVVVEELGAANGTFVNGTQALADRPLPVKAGDVVRFGLVELKVVPA